MKVMLGWLACLPLHVFAASQPASQPATAPAHRQVAMADTDDIPESSGVVASRRNPGVYWTHNDSGDAPRVWAVRLTPPDRARRVARVLGCVELRGASSADWEDIAWGAGSRVYLLDGGDNPPCDRGNKRIHRFVEPPIDADGPRFRIPVAFETMRFEYPDPQNPGLPARRNDQRYDAECLFVHPATQDIYIVTKRDTNKIPVARVYRFPGRQVRWDAPEALHVLEFVADISGKTRRLPGLLSIVHSISGGDIDAAGRRVVLRDYAMAFEFVLAPGQPFERIFEQPPRTVSLIGEMQGEGICYSLDGRELITTSEVQEFKLTRCPLFATPAPSASASQPTP